MTQNLGWGSVPQKAFQITIWTKKKCSGQMELCMGEEESEGEKSTCSPIC